MIPGSLASVKNEVKEPKTARTTFEKFEPRSTHFKFDRSQRTSMESLSRTPRKSPFRLDRPSIAGLKTDRTESPKLELVTPRQFSKARVPKLQLPARGVQSMRHLRTASLTDRKNIQDGNYPGIDVPQKSFFTTEVDIGQLSTRLPSFTQSSEFISGTGEMYVSSQKRGVLIEQKF